MKTRLVALGRLLRISLLPCALADVAAGTVAASGLFSKGPQAGLMLTASACIYHGGMALNDWADRTGDLALRPDRPIPSGKISGPWALGIALALLSSGTLVGLVADPMAGTLLALVALAAIVYDLRGRGALRGPLLLALCRAGNLGAGVLLGLRLADPALHWGQLTGHARLLVVPVLYGLFVFFVSRLGRLEDLTDGRPLGPEPARLLRRCALVMLALGLWAPFSMGTPDLVSQATQGFAWIHLVFPILLVCLGSRALWAETHRSHWTPGLVTAAMGLCLRRLLVLSAAIAAAAPSSDGLLVAACILCGYPFSFWLRKVFPPS